MLWRKQSFCPCWECFSRRLLWPNTWTQRAVAPLAVESDNHTTPPMAGLPQVPWWSHLQGHMSAAHALWPYHLRNEGQPAGEIQLWRHLCQEVSPWVSLVSPFIARYLFSLCLLLRFPYPPLRDPWVPVFISVSGRWFQYHFSIRLTLSPWLTPSWFLCLEPSHGCPEHSMVWLAQTHGRWAVSLFGSCTRQVFIRPKWERGQKTGLL